MPLKTTCREDGAMASEEDVPRSDAGGTDARFEVLMEPTGLFAVFDTEAGLPAEIEARALIGLERAEAVALCRFLNRRTAAIPNGAAPRPEPRRHRRWPPRVLR